MFSKQMKNVMVISIMLSLRHTMFSKQMKNVMVISIMLSLSFLRGYIYIFFYGSRDLVRTPFLEPYGHMLSHFLTCTRFIC